MFGRGALYRTSRSDRLVSGGAVSVDPRIRGRRAGCPDGTLGSGVPCLLALVLAVDVDRVRDGREPLGGRGRRGGAGDVLNWWKQFGIFVFNYYVNYLMVHVISQSLELR